jgi:hypothetical protein
MNAGTAAVAAAAETTYEPRAKDIRTHRFNSIQHEVTDWRVPKIRNDNEERLDS